MLAVDYVIFVLSILLIITVGLQQSQDNVQDAFSGEKSDLFKDQKARGIELFLMRTSLVLSIAFVALIFVTLYLHGR